MPTDFLITLNDLRLRVGELLNRLAGDAPTEESKERVAFLGQIAAGLAVLGAESLPATGAGFGSVVTVKNLLSGNTAQYTLMLGALLDIDANQVSLASPIGQALLGSVAGDEITIATPNRPLKLRVLQVSTLFEQLELHEAGATVL